MGQEIPSLTLFLFYCTHDSLESRKTYDVEHFFQIRGAIVGVEAKTEASIVDRSSQIKVLFLFNLTWFISFYVSSKSVLVSNVVNHSVNTMFIFVSVRAFYFMWMSTFFVSVLSVSMAIFDILTMEKKKEKRYDTNELGVKITR